MARRRGSQGPDQYKTSLLWRHGKCVHFTLHLAAVLLYKHCSCLGVFLGPVSLRKVLSAILLTQVTPAAPTHFYSTRPRAARPSQMVYQVSVSLLGTHYVCKVLLWVLCVFCDFAHRHRKQPWYSASFYQIILLLHNPELIRR